MSASLANNAESAAVGERAMSSAVGPGSVSTATGEGAKSHAEGEKAIATAGGKYSSSSASAFESHAQALANYSLAEIGMNGKKARATVDSTSEAGTAYAGGENSNVYLGNNSKSSTGVTTDGAKDSRLTIDGSTGTRATVGGTESAVVIQSSNNTDVVAGGDVDVDINNASNYTIKLNADGTQAGKSTSTASHEQQVANNQDDDFRVYVNGDKVTIKDATGKDIVTDQVIDKEKGFHYGSGINDNRGIRVDINGKPVSTPAADPNEGASFDEARQAMQRERHEASPTGGPGFVDDFLAVRNSDAMQEQGGAALRSTLPNGAVLEDHAGSIQASNRTTDPLNEGTRTLSEQERGREEIASIQADIARNNGITDPNKIAKGTIIDSTGVQRLSALSSTDIPELKTTQAQIDNSAVKTVTDNTQILSPASWDFSEAKEEVQAQFSNPGDKDAAARAVDFIDSREKVLSELDGVSGDLRVGETTPELQNISKALERYPNLDLGKLADIGQANLDRKNRENGKELNIINDLLRPDDDQLRLRFDDKGNIVDENGLMVLQVNS